MKSNFMAEHRPFLIYVHVEKAGGITINNMLHHYLWSYISPRPRYGEQFEKRDLEIIQRFYPFKIKGIGGHRISPTEVYAENQFRFSMIRNPVKRYISHLNWQINKMGIDHTLESFLENKYFQNFQTFRLTRSRDFKEAQEIISKNYNFIGILEEFDCSVELLSQLYFNDVNYLRYEKKNITTKSNVTYTIDDLPNNVMDEIRSKNQVDIDIYNWVYDDLYLPIKESLSERKVDKPFLQTPLITKLKRKTSNAYVGRILQPLFQKRVEYGY